MTLLPYISPGKSAWRKQANATNTIISQFNYNKTGDRENLFTSQT